MMTRCNMTYGIEGDNLWIIDLKTPGCRFLTDFMEMERALEALDRSGINIEEYEIIFCDHRGLWQGVLLVGLRPVDVEYLSFDARSLEGAKTIFQLWVKEYHEKAGIPNFQSEGGC